MDTSAFINFLSISLLELVPLVSCHEHFVDMQLEQLQVFCVTHFCVRNFGALCRLCCCVMFVTLKILMRMFILMHCVAICNQSFLIVYF